MIIKLGNKKRQEMKRKPAFLIGNVLFLFCSQTQSLFEYCHSKLVSESKPCKKDYI